MNGMKQPSVSVAPPPVISDGELSKLIKACSGKDFDDYRDLAIIRLLLTGMRRGEIAGLKVEDLTFGKGTDAPSYAVVTGKTGTRNCPFGHKTAKALLRYLYEHRDAHLPNLWLGYHGPLTDNGIYQIVKRRATKAGLGKIYTHLFRHTAAHRKLLPDDRV